MANLHVLRCLETEGPCVVPKVDQTFLSNCQYAVTYATGKNSVQFNADKYPSLAASHSLYSQELPLAHQQPERPTFIKDVSVATPGPMLRYHSSSYLQCLSCYYCLLCSMYVLRVLKTMPCALQMLDDVCLTIAATQHALHNLDMRPCALQILNSASLMTRTNFANHVAINFFSRTLRWIRLQLGQHIYFANLEYKLVRSWANFVCRAATEGIPNIWDLLPRYTSLAQPPAATMDYLDYLVLTIRSLIGPLPVTDWSLQHQPESYLPWLHLVLQDFQDAQGEPHAPKLFTMLPQRSNHTHKLNSAAQVSTTAVCRNSTCSDATSSDAI